MSDDRSKPDAQLLAVVTAAVVAALEARGDTRGFRVVSVEQAKAEGMG